MLSVDSGDIRIGTLGPCPIGQSAEVWLRKAMTFLLLELYSEIFILQKQDSFE